MNKFKDFLTESSLSRVLDHVKNRNMGIITAHRHDTTLSSDENTTKNKQNNEKLKKDIRDNGFGYIHVKGRFIENHGTPEARPVDEHSFIVVAKPDHADKLKEFLKTHGQKYNQDSILFKKHDEDHVNLIGTSHRDSWLKHGEESSVGQFHPSRMGEFHSLLKGNRPFAFGESVQETSPNFEEVKFSYDVPQSFFNRGGEYETEF